MASFALSSAGCHGNGHLNNAMVTCELKAAGCHRDCLWSDAAAPCFCCHHNASQLCGLCFGIAGFGGSGT